MQPPNDIDPRFKQAKKRAAQRRRKASVSRYALPVLGVSALVGGLVAAAVLTWDQWTFGPIEVTEEALENELTAADIAQDLQATAAFTAAFIDLPGDPLLIRFAENLDGETVRKLPTPTALARPDRISPRLILVSDVMVSAEERFITTLPSSQDDFAFFNARKAAPVAAVQDAEDTADIATGADTGVDLEDDGWGASLGGAQAEDGAAPEAEPAPRIANTISTAQVLDQSARPKAPRDIFVRISADQPLTELLRTKGFAERDVDPVATVAREELGLEQLLEGQVVALRGQDVPGEGFRFLQASFYASDSYFGSLGRGDDGSIGVGTDPWVDDNLFDYTGQSDEGGSQEIKYRMMDAFYSTAIRNRVPSALVGEAIALLSRSHDLDAFAAPGDRMILLYSEERIEDETGAGQILYIALKGDAVTVECFVFREGANGDYKCYGATAERTAARSGPRAGMTPPVQGVLTSRFGPRNHPILNEVKLHAGVDWAAPIGTPVVAAFSGVVSGAGDAGGYGNLVRLRHANGTETRYAHLDTIDVAQGQRVQGGQQIGTVGTTGRSTGPHLHFELRENGAPVDPLSGGGGGGGTAVAALVDRIVQIESGGRADAKNPLSTATGLGQFIESTWLRMMRTYRPDLNETMSREELLALRTDPTISREMVENLAREGEAYLRARGHEITAGRLYLCHFLGAAAADIVLKAAQDAALLDVLGEAVIRANPFLTGKNVAYIQAWAEKKMSGGRGATVVVAEPAGLPAFRSALQSLMEAG